MNSKKYLLFILLVILGLILSACSSTAYSSTSWHGLSPDTDTVYLAAGSQVYAVDIKSGSENWRYPAKPNTKISFYAAPVLTPDGQLILAGYDHKLYSLNPKTGSENWIFEGPTNRLIGSPLVTETMIYQPSADNSVYAVDMNGKKVWSQETDGPVWAQPVTDPDCGCIYVASMDHTLYSMDAQTGRILWQTPELGGAMVGSPAVGTDGILYVGTFGSEMLALDSKDGEVVWRFKTEDWVWSGPVLANDALYFGDLSGYFYALNAADGTSQWRIQPQNGIVEKPVVLDDKIYLTTEGDSLFIISTNGDVLTSRVIGGTIYSSPVITGDTILVAPTNFDSLLVAMTMDANQKWTFTPEKK